MGIESAGKSTNGIALTRTYGKFIAFSISKDFQKKGLGKILLKKLAEAARSNDISGLVAYTSPQNEGMIRLFKQLPYNVNTFFDGDVLTLKCKFNEPV